MYDHIKIGDLTLSQINDLVTHGVCPCCKSVLCSTEEAYKCSTCEWERQRVNRRLPIVNDNPRISLVVAMDDNNLIGKDNKLPWYLKEDLRYFKDLTQGHYVLMGGNCHNSIGFSLHLRTNIVITHNRQHVASRRGCILAHSIEEALGLSRKEEEVFVIGGSEIYKQFLPIADYLYITHIKASFEGDCYFPSIDYTEWEEVSRVRNPRGESFPHPFDFISYKRKHFNVEY